MGSLASLRDQADPPDDAGASKESTELTPAVSRKSAKPNHYCLGNGHHPRLLTEDRFFYWDLSQPGCPICPVCEKQVNAQAVAYNAKGQPLIPDGLLGLASRIGEPV